MGGNVSGAVPAASLSRRPESECGQLSLAIIANEQTPYRLHLHRRIAREIREIELWSIFTHELASSPWRYTDDLQIRSVLFGEGQSTQAQQSLRGFAREWTKGGRIIHWLEKHRIQAVVLFGYNDPARVRIVRWAAGKGVACFLFGDSNIRSDQAAGLKAVVKRRYVRWILRQTSAVFHCGSLGREYFMRYGVPASRLYAFPYEPDYALFSRAGPQDPIGCRRFAMPEGKRYLLFVGRMIAAKRPDLLLTAFEAIAQQRPEWDVVMVGDGPLRDPLQRRFADRIHWLGFIRDPAELAALYGICDVFVLPSDVEPWGVVLTEAATRLALIASSAVGAAADVVEDGLNGRTFQRGDVNGLRDAILEVTDPDNTDRMKAASPTVLAGWREWSDPVANLRRALRDSQLLEPEHVHAC